ncbi:4Fe-4S dicluster domain-containing protein [Candidatus Bathyarchaeota archaeon]|nr:4Fe-4S dicluster domain-containing protein [Candidatus Bathyarchaeota archaeon]
MITHYGYIDGSGEYYIVVDSDKCSGCRKCVIACPEKALELVTEFIDLEDKTVAAIAEEHRKKIRYTCTGCKPETQQTPCISACPSSAISIVWNPR